MMLCGSHQIGMTFKSVFFFVNIHDTQDYTALQEKQSPKSIPTNVFIVAGCLLNTTSHIHFEDLK